MGYQDDYGGHHYGKRGRHKTGLDNRRSFRCLSCRKMRYVLLSELARAANVHCLECGGALEETAADQKKNYSKSKKRNPRRRCPGCGTLIGNNDELSIHLGHKKECLKSHSDRSLLVGDTMVIPGTVTVNKVATSKWHVTALTESGERVEIFKCGTRQMCRQWVRDKMGPVELAR